MNNSIGAPSECTGPGDARHGRRRHRPRIAGLPRGRTHLEARGAPPGRRQGRELAAQAAGPGHWPDRQPERRRLRLPPRPGATRPLRDVLLSDRTPLLVKTCERATRWALRARDPYGVWRYEVPSVGDADTSITGWMVFALEAARDAGFEVGREAFAASLDWIDQATDPGVRPRRLRGARGPERAGQRSQRPPSPPRGGEAMTARGSALPVLPRPGPLGRARHGAARGPPAPVPPRVGPRRRHLRHVLLVLRHLRDVPDGREALGRLEQGDEEGRGRIPAQGRRLPRLLGPPPAPGGSVEAGSTPRHSWSCPWRCTSATRAVLGAR